MVKVFTTNSDGKIEFTKEELETLLNEMWQDGYNAKQTINAPYTWRDTTAPKTTPPFISICSADDLKWRVSDVYND